MASTSVLRSSRLLASSSPKPILKRTSRPSPLPLSPGPFPFTTAFNAMISSRSPHVHFPPSPALFSTYAAHSPNSYDRGPYPISPNSNPSPLSPPHLRNGSGFKLSDPPKRRTGRATTAATTLGHEPNVFEEQDPRSPRPTLLMNLAAALSQGTKLRTELGKALLAFPRSPFPSAPASPSSDVGLGNTNAVEPPSQQMNTSSSEYNPGREGNYAGRKRRNTSDGVINPVLARPPRVMFLDEMGTNRRSITFKLTSSRRLAPPHLDLSAAKTTPYLTPVQEVTASAEMESESDGFELGGQSSLSVGAIENERVGKQTQDKIQTVESVDGNESDVSIAESLRLSNAFWESMSLDELSSSGSARFGSEGEFPESVTGSQVSDSEDVVSIRTQANNNLPSLMSPRPQPQERVTLLFGRNDGSLWSPGLRQEEHRESLSSPRLPAGMNLHWGPLVVRSAYTAPSPKDPFAKFPSFSAVLNPRNAGAMMVRPLPKAHLL
ncbi:hypothetical protein AX15_007543 [Amanita polypyramis BW_CC]|nr:hypothetical protein AX15_007543 [Amanita polypyramis BW_CC]